MSALPIQPIIHFKSSFSPTERIKELKEKFHDFKLKISLPDNIDLSLIGFKTAHADCKNKTVKLPSWILFKYEDIPSRFLINDVNDPQLLNDQFLDDFVSWMNEKLVESGLSAVSRPTSNESLQKLILLLRDRDLFEKSKNFIFAHELGHLHYNGQRTLPLGIIAVGIIALCVSLAVIPFIGLTIGLIGAGIAIVVTSVGASQLPTLSSIEQEKRADLDALKMTGDAHGGIYYFEMEGMLRRRLRLLGGQHVSDYDEKGNHLHNKTHPSVTDRIAYLREWQIEENFRKNISARPLPVTSAENSFHESFSTICECFHYCR